MPDSSHDPENSSGSTTKPSLTAHHLDHPAPIEPIYNIDPFTPIFAPPIVISEQMADSLEDNGASADAIPDPEPSAPSLEARIPLCSAAIPANLSPEPDRRLARAARLR